MNEHNFPFVIFKWSFIQKNIENRCQYEIWLCKHMTKIIFGIKNLKLSGLKYGVLTNVKTWCSFQLKDFLKLKSDNIQNYWTQWVGGGGDGLHKIRGLGQGNSWVWPWGCYGTLGPTIGSNLVYEALVLATYSCSILTLYKPIE